MSLQGTGAGSQVVCGAAGFLLKLQPSQRESLILLRLRSVCGSRHRRHAPVLGRSGGLRFSSIRHAEASPQQDQVIQGSVRNSDNSLLAIQGMVSGPPVPSPGATSTTSGSLGPPVPAAREEIPSEAFHASTSCMEVLQRLARASGFSSRVAEQLVRCRGKSSLRLYQSKWSVYRRWCWEKGHSVSKPSIPKIADFLLWLWKAKSLSVSAIKGYRSMLLARDL